MDALQYKRTSKEFRRLASNMLNTSYDEGNLHLIRLKIYIQENPIILKLLNEKIDKVVYDGDFIVDVGGWTKSLNIPIKQDEHIKVIYDYLLEMTSEEIDLREIARRFDFVSGGTKYTDIIRSYLLKVFGPLVDFIVDELSMEMMMMEPEKRETHINIGNNYGTANVAEGNIQSTNIINGEDKVKVNQLIEELKGLIKAETLDEGTCEEVTDDLDTIQEQLECEQPKKVRLKNACERIKTFAKCLPKGLAEATIIVSKLHTLLEEVAKFTQ